MNIHEWLIIGMTSPFSSGGMILVVFGQELVVLEVVCAWGPASFSSLKARFSSES